MGLDMYLKAKKYAANYAFSDEKDKKMVAVVLKAANMTHLIDEDSPNIYVETTVAYWRKANAIHSWFVQNVQDGVDECQCLNYFGIPASKPSTPTMLEI
jgi:hypothetical protein